MRQFQERFASSVALFNLILISSLVYTCVRTLCLVDVWSEHTNTDPIAAARAVVEVPIYAIHPPLALSKTVSSS